MLEPEPEPEPEPKVAPAPSKKKDALRESVPILKSAGAAFAKKDDPAQRAEALQLYTKGYSLLQQALESGSKSQAVKDQLTKKAKGVQKRISALQAMDGSKAEPEQKPDQAALVLLRDAHNAEQLAKRGDDVQFQTFKRLEALRLYTEGLEQLQLALRVDNRSAKVKEALAGKVRKVEKKIAALQQDAPLDAQPSERGGGQSGDAPEAAPAGTADASDESQMLAKEAEQLEALNSASVPVPTAAAEVSASNDEAATRSEEEAAAEAEAARFRALEEQAEAERVAAEQQAAREEAARLAEEEEAARVAAEAARALAKEEEAAELARLAAAEAEAEASRAAEAEAEKARVAAAEAARAAAEEEAAKEEAEREAAEKHAFEEAQRVAADKAAAKKAAKMRREKQAAVAKGPAEQAQSDDPLPDTPTPLVDTAELHSLDLQVAGIPEELADEVSLREQFAKFGAISNLRVQPRPGLNKSECSLTIACTADAQALLSDGVKVGSGSSAAVLAVSEVKAPEPQPEPEQSAAPQTPGLPPLPGAAESLPPLPGAGKRRMSLATVTLAGGKLDLGVDADVEMASPTTRQVLHDEALRLLEQEDRTSAAVVEQLLKWMGLVTFFQVRPAVV